MPIDINELREYKGGNPEKYRQYMLQRYKKVDIVNEVIELDTQWRTLRNSIDSKKKDVNQLQKNVIAPKKKNKEDCEIEVLQMKEIQASIKEMELQIPMIEKQRDLLLNRIGNIVDKDVPISKDEDNDNLVIQLSSSLKTNSSSSSTAEEQQVTGVGVESLSVSSFVPFPLKEWDSKGPNLPKKPIQHDELLWRIGGYEPNRGVNVAGHRAYFLTNAGVLLNQAIINYSIMFLSARGYQVVQPPFFMNKDVMASIAQLEDFDEQLYKISGRTDDVDGISEKYLIATSEQPLCAYHQGEWIEPSNLPLRYAGISTCFRKEAGSAGKDIRGIFRVHQFEKIEQFCITMDDIEQSQLEQQRMLQCATDFYDSLKIDYRVVTIVSGALNDAAIKKYDLEGWFPGQGTYRELVSCSNCTDYQARGVGVRCGSKKETKVGDLTARASYCHMLNSTLCATGRGICCILENYQTDTGVIVPEVLRPYMGGKDFLPFVRDAPLDSTTTTKK